MVLYVCQGDNPKKVWNGEFKMLRISDIIRELEEIKAEHGDLIVMHQDDGGYEEELKYGLVCDVKDRDIGRMME